MVSDYPSGLTIRIDSDVLGVLRTVARDEPEHKVERGLSAKVKASTSSSGGSSRDNRSSRANSPLANSPHASDSAHSQVLNSNST